MQARNATVQDLEDLRKRIERRSEEPESVQIIEGDIKGFVEKWPGTDDPDLWVHILGRKERQDQQEKEPEKSVKAAPGAARRQKSKSSDMEKNVEKRLEDEIIIMFGFTTAFIGAIFGAALTLMIQWIF